MSEDVDTASQEEAKQPSEHSHLFHAARKFLLAGIGAMALAQDEIEDFVDRLVERGEIAKKDRATLIHEVMEHRKQHMEKIEARVSKRMEEMLDRMNVPDKSDIEALSEKIAALTRQVEELSKRKS